MTLFSAVIAVAYFGLNFNPAMTNSATESRIYPVDASTYRMVQPDGVPRIFTLTDAERGVLSGPKPWIGAIKDRRIDVWAAPERTGGKLRTAYTFIDGRLRLLVLDGRKYTFDRNETAESGLAELFPERKPRSYARNSAADIWKGGGRRLRLWFANPNSAGIFLGELLLLLLWLMTRTRGAAMAAAGVLAAASTYGVLATGSRGALAGVIFGLMAFAAAYARRLFSRRGFLILLAGALLAVSALAVSGHMGRVVGTFRTIDSGNATRLKIGKAAVMMFSDAPAGWQGGEVPGRNACLNWYVYDQPRSLRTHVMSLAECGWLKGWLYIAFWMLMLSAGVMLVFRGNPLVASLWASLGVAGCFNPVYRDWETWALPLLSLAALGFGNGRLSIRQWCLAALTAAGLSVVAESALIAVGKALPRPTQVSVSSRGRATFVNGENPRIWVVGDPLVMGGLGFPGREILAYYHRHAEAEALAYVYDVADLPDEAEFVVVAGRNVPDYLLSYAEGRACRAGTLLFLSPSVNPEAVPTRLQSDSRVLWLAGSLLASRDPSYAVKRQWVRIVPGRERYLPEWLDVAFTIGGRGK